MKTPLALRCFPKFFNQRMLQVFPLLSREAKEIGDVCTQAKIGEANQLPQHGLQ